MLGQHVAVSVMATQNEGSMLTSTGLADAENFPPMLLCSIPIILTVVSTLCQLVLVVFSWSLD